MSENLIVQVEITLNADSAKVWDALTDPALIKQYLFGTETECDWKVGSPIYFRGEWQGKKYEDKGTILALYPKKFLKYSYWSSMSGTADVPENYSNVTFELSQNGNATVLTLIQDGNKTVESKKHSEENWGYVLAGLKKIVEEK